MVREELNNGFVSNLPILDNLGREQNALCISEPALTLFVSRSRTEMGKAMNRWIHIEVLPSIRKTGSYSLAKRQSIAGTEARLIGKRGRRTLTDAIRDYIARHEHELSDSQKQWLYSNATNRTYLELFSVQAKKLVEIHGCKKTELRDYLTIEETSFLQALETCAARMIDVEDMYPLDAIKAVSATMHLKDLFALTYQEVAKQIKAAEA